MLTREVRWFHRGAVPSRVVAWFEGLAGGSIPEHRIDTYDVTAARRGIGIKRRNRQTIDAKFPLRTGVLELGAGIVGRVEDWVKIIVPGTGPGTIPNGLDIDKHIVTHRYPLPGHPDAGCEVELASITAGSQQAWTIAIETLGPPSALEASFAVGVAGLRSGAPAPAGLHFVGSASYGYPVWIQQLVQIG